MRRLLDLIENNVQKDSGYISEYINKESSRDIYLNGHVYEEYKMDLIFLIDTGDWFKKTIRFDIKLNNYNNEILVRKGYGYEYEAYDRKEFKRIIGFINKEINEFFLKNKVEINKNIKTKKII